MPFLTGKKGKNIGYKREDRGREEKKKKNMRKRQRVSIIMKNY